MLLSTCILALGTTSFDVPVKHLGAPAVELDRGWLREPDPATHGARARHSVHETTFVGDTAEFTVEVPSGESLKLLPAGDGSDRWSITAISPGGKHDGTSDRSTIRRGTMMPGSTVPAQRLDILAPEPGTWTVRVTGGLDGQVVRLLVEDGSDLHLRAWLDDYATHVGDRVTVHLGCARWDDVPENGHVAMSRAAIDGASILSTTARLRHADGSTEWLASRGPTLTLQPLTAGVHTVIVDALLAFDGDLLHRTVSLPIAVEDDAPTLSGRLVVREVDAHRTSIDLMLATGTARDRVIAGAEVWATASDGHLPRCWIGGVTPVSADSVQLVLDTRWLHGCDPDSIELRSLRLADVDTFVPLVRSDRQPLPTVRIDDTAPTGDDARVMRTGIPMAGRTVPGPVHRSAAAPLRSAQPGGHNLMLVHGYCEDGDAWPLNQFSGDFTEYLNLYQNFSHDQFALDIRAFGQQYKSFSVIGHSQGGNAALHLYSFYWSGMDWSTGARKVQALGSPLRGTPLAGSIADLGAIFGIQCGSNYDMTYDGAAQWASFLPGEPRSAAWVWSTTFEDGWFWDYCNIGSDILLSDPEDGVVEVSGAHLDGTNDMGTKEGWCHIQGMSDPAQTLDTQRNAEMNAEGAR
tara:strand:- start:5289 stop:7187 length:1899 start_codon:yes stop_codon:yes gene_type:complete